MSLRAYVKTAAAEALCRTGADRLWRVPAPERALVLGYHQVVEDGTRAGSSVPAMTIRTSTLERQLDELGRCFRFVTLDELAAGLESGRTAGRPVVAVTFDDGYRDVYEHALPLLRRKGIPGAVFVVTDLVGTEGLLRHDRLYLLLSRAFAQPPAARSRLGHVLRGLGWRVPILEGGEDGPPGNAYGALRALLEAAPAAHLERLMDELVRVVGPFEPRPELQVLDWDMVRALHRAGFTVGSHTCTHVLLTREGPERVRIELAASRRRLEGELGSPIRHLAYPDGRFDEAVIGAAADAGYAFAYTTCQHRDRRRPLLTISRRLLWEDSCRAAGGGFSPSLLRCQVLGVFDVARRCRQEHESSPAARLEPLPA